MRLAGTFCSAISPSCPVLSYAVGPNTSGFITSALPVLLAEPTLAVPLTKASAVNDLHCLCMSMPEGQRSPRQSSQHCTPCLCVCPLFMHVSPRSISHTFALVFTATGPCPSVLHTIAQGVDRARASVHSGLFLSLHANTRGSTSFSHWHSQSHPLSVPGTAPAH